MVFMKTIAETYRDRLQLLIQQYDSQIAFAEAINKNSSQVSQWVNASPDSKTGTPRSLTEKSARRIEQILDLPRAWMDQPINPNRLSSSTAHALTTNTSIGVPLIEQIILTNKGITTLLNGQDTTHTQLITPPDDSMAPTFTPLSLLLLDTHTTRFTVNGIYLLRLQEQLFLRRLHLSKNNVLNVTADNVAYQASNFTLTESECNALHIIGKAEQTLQIAMTSL